MRDRDAEVLVGIYWGVVDADFVVKMRARGASAFSNIANHVAAVNRLPGGDCKSGKVAIAGADAVAVVDHDVLCRIRP